MLRACSPTSFYLNGELIDTNYLEWSARIPKGGRNHKKTSRIIKKLQAVTNLRLLAYTLNSGQRYDDENSVKEWIKEISK